MGVDELTAEALAADPDAEVAPDAVPFTFDGHGEGLLPDWYMPGRAASAGGHAPRRRLAVAGIVAALVVVSGAGLCVTYGTPEVGDRILSP